MTLTYELVARRIDHALLLPTLTPEEIESGARIASEYGVASVCVKPSSVPLASSILSGTQTKVGTVIGFPHGGQSTEVKVFECVASIEAGATELDMVVNIGWVRGGRWDDVAKELQAVVEAAHRGGALLKVIFENCYLNDDQKKQLCVICGDVAADYVKTSTGFGTSGATEADLILMKKSIPTHVRLKAAGGMRDLDTALRFIEIGCDRLGTSKTGEILDELCRRLGLPIRSEDGSDVSRETSDPKKLLGNDY